VPCNKITQKSRIVQVQPTLWTYLRHVAEVINRINQVLTADISAVHTAEFVRQWISLELIYIAYGKRIELWVSSFLTTLSIVSSMLMY